MNYVLLGIMFYLIIGFGYAISRLRKLEKDSWWTELPETKDLPPEILKIVLIIAGILMVLGWPMHFLPKREEE